MLYVISRFFLSHIVFNLTIEWTPWASQPIHTGGQSPKAITLMNAYKAINFIKAMDSWRKFRLDRNENPNYGLEAVKIININKNDKILAIRLEGCFG